MFVCLCECVCVYVNWCIHLLIKLTCTSYHHSHQVALLDSHCASLCQAQAHLWPLYCSQFASLRLVNWWWLGGGHVTELAC